MDNSSTNNHGWATVILCLIALLGPYFFFLWLWQDEPSAFVAGGILGFALLAIVIHCLPDLDPDVRRSKQIASYKKCISITDKLIRDELTTLIALEDQYNNGQFHLREEIEKHKKKIEKEKKDLALFQSLLAQSEEEERRWHELRQRADERFNQIIKSTELTQATDKE